MSPLTFSSEVHDSLLLFLSVVGLVQVFWLVSTKFNLFINYYPTGLTVHVLLYLSEFALLYFYVKITRKHSFSNIGFRKASQWKSYAAVGFGFAVFHNIIAFIISSVFIGLKHGYYLPLYVYIPVYFAFYWIISIPEEGIFGGCILRQLLHKYGGKTAMTVSSIMFGLYHIYYIPLIVYRNPVDMLFQAAYAFHSFTAGLFLAYFYYKTGENLIGPVAYHFSQMFFNIPFLWMHGEVTFSSQIAALMLSSLLNFIQILVLKFVRRGLLLVHHKFYVHSCFLEPWKRIA